MTEAAVNFDDGAVYERFMGRWSRAVGHEFLDWLDAPKKLHWLDVGCGTGVFTQLILDRGSPAAVTAIDPAPAQIGHVRSQPLAQRADFRVADAVALPFPERTFDIVASALVINFIPDRPRAVAEMRRVSRPGGTVAAYVWDFAGRRGTAWPFARSMRELGIDAPNVPGTAELSIDGLTTLFETAGLEAIATRWFDVTIAFPSFDDFWQSQTPPFTPNGKAIAALPAAERAKLADAVRAAVPARPDGSVAYSARANAIKAHVPAS